MVNEAADEAVKAINEHKNFPLYYSGLSKLPVTKKLTPRNCMDNMYKHLGDINALRSKLKKSPDKPKKTGSISDSFQQLGDYLQNGR